MKKIVLLSLFFILSGCQALKLNEYYQNISNKNLTEVSFLAVGDNLIHYPIYESSYKNGDYNFNPIYENIKPFIKRFDLAFINQESILGGTALGLSSYPLFNSPYEVGEALVDSGFNLISLANNHSLDKGEVGIINSTKFWESKNVIYSGTERNDKPHVKLFNKKGIKFAFVAYTYGTNGINLPGDKSYLVSLFEKDKVKRDILSVRELADVIIVSMHWGDEYHKLPNDIQTEQSNFLASLGVDIILGHHPHVIQPFKIIQSHHHKTIVCYSLGNFLSDQRGIDRLVGMVFTLNIQKLSNDQIYLKNPHAKLVYTYKNKDKQFKIIFLNKVTEQHLPNKEDLLAEKRQLLRQYNPEIEVT